jgi:hypothetical protein
MKTEFNTILRKTLKNKPSIIRGRKIRKDKDGYFIYYNNMKARLELKREKELKNTIHRTFYIKWYE